MQAVLKRLLVERGHVLIQRRAGAILEDVQLGILDTVLQPISEPGGGHHIVAPEGDLCRSADLAELRAFADLK
jgi:hypothetical protein